MMDIIMPYLEPAFYILIIGVILYFIPFDEEELRRIRQNSQVYMNRPVIHNHFSSLNNSFLDNLQIPSINSSILESNIPYSFGSLNPSNITINTTNSTNSFDFRNLNSNNQGKKCPTCRETSRNCCTIFSETKCIICFENVSKVKLFNKCSHANVCEKCFESL